jgi:hypothetical protein
MPRLVFAALLIALAGPAHAQVQAPPAPPPTPEEIAFSRLPADIRAMLAGKTAAQAMQSVALARQHTIALGMPDATPEQFRSTLGALLGSPYSTYVSASAGATTFPPLSPLVPPPPPPFLR